jgi:hypothetical protein
VASSTGTRQWRAGVLDIGRGSGEGIRRRQARLLRRGSTDGSGSELRRQGRERGGSERELWQGEGEGSASDFIEGKGGRAEVAGCFMAAMNGVGLFPGE